MSEELEQSEVPEESEFDAAFNEFAAPGEDKAELDPEPEDKAEAAEEIKAGEEAPQDEEAKPVEPDDLYAGLTDEQKAHFEGIEDSNKTLTHRIDSDAGRVSAFQRKINGLQTEIQEIREGSTTGEMPSKTDIADAMKGTDDEWAQFTEDYPEVARAIDNRLGKAGDGMQGAVNKSMESVANTATEISETVATNANATRIAVVAEVYPTWTEAVQTPKFKTWLDDQPPGINALASSDDTKDASALIGMYDSYLVANGEPSLKVPDPTEPGVEKEAEELPDGPSELEQKRAQQLEAGTSVDSKRAGIDPGAKAPDEFEAAFDYHAKRKERQRA